MSRYEELQGDLMDNHLSNFLIDYWSYSGVQTFARNEKAFEMQYIYREKFKSSATSVAGSAYHAVLEAYFNLMMQPDIITLEDIAFKYIQNIQADKWKISKTTPSIEQCVLKAQKTVTGLLNNFFQESDVYNIDSVLAVELSCYEWLTINGVDIPLPTKGVIDLVAKQGDKTILIDHKSKAAYTDEKELTFTSAKQAITYVLLYEKKTGQKVDEVWFVENKASKNRDKSAQLKCFKITIDKDTRMLYESLLYDSLKRMIEAVSNPDHIYIVNDSDNFVDKAELYNFWARTQIAELDEFDIADNKKEIMENRRRKIKDSSIAFISPKVISNFKKNASSFIEYNFNNSDMTPNEKIEHVLKTLSLNTKIEHTFDGYSSNTFLMKIGAGQAISKIFKHKLDIANALGLSGVRINSELKEYQDNSFVSIEASKKPKDRKMLPWDEKELIGNKIPIGRNNFDEVVYWDLDSHSTPHILVCGATGSGKSVCLNSTIEYAKKTDIERIIILDPKYEFTFKKGVEVYNEIEDIERVMHELVLRMNENVRNRKKERIMIIFDEFADAMSNATKEKDLIQGVKHLEENLRVLLQKGRSIGFRIVAATQRASVKVITGDAKVNFPVQVCFRVPKSIDSKVVIDEEGAELLGGKGDGLIKSPDLLHVERFQGYFKEMD